MLKPGETNRRVTVSGLATALPRGVRDTAHVTASLFAVVAAYVFVRSGFQEDVVGFDFEGTLWNAATAIREGRSPYPAPSRSDLEVGNPAVYPPLLMLLVTPLTLVPWSLGLLVWAGVLVAAILGSLWVLGVRDSRCYALAAFSLPVVSGLVFGNVTLLLVLLVALSWRWRGSWRRCGLVLGVAIAAKLFLWPLLFWLVGSRRYRAALMAAGTGLVALLLPWALIGFDGLASYYALLRAMEGLFAVHGFSIATMLAAFGADPWAAVRVALAIGFVLAAFALVAGRRGSEEVAFSLALLGAILGSPIVWEYYYALLVVPVAIASPRFSGLWVALTLFHLTTRLPRPRLADGDFLPGGVACCRPDDVPLAVWTFNHQPPGVWPALGAAVLASLVVARVAVTSRRQRHRDGDAAS